MPNLLSTTTSGTTLSISQTNPETLRGNSFINALPPELLLIIFNLLFDGEQVECHVSSCFKCTRATDSSPEPHLIWRPVSENPSLQNFFPYTVANVCRRWRDVTAAVPKYWTRLVFLVDSESDLGTPSEHLSWSRDLPLDVTVMRRSYNLAERDELERRRVREVTGALMPHVERCTILSFEVVYSSSLPSLRRDLSLSKFTALFAFLLRSVEDDGPAPYQCWPGLNNFITEAHFPALASLDIDGPNFIDLCTHIITSRDSNKCYNPFRGLQKLTIINLTSANTLPMNTILEKVFNDSIMTSLYSLGLENVYFTPQKLRLPHEDPYVLSISHLELENMDRNVVESFFGMVEFRHLDSAGFKAIQITPSFILPDSWSITVESFDFDTLPPQPFIEWGGGLLNIINCSGFTDDFLDALSNPSFANWGEFGCPNLQEMHIVDCPNFTVQALKTMVANRNESLGDRQALVDDNDDPPVIIELHVIGEGPSLSVEDRLWFQRKVALFQWDTE